MNKFKRYFSKLIEKFLKRKPQEQQQSYDTIAIQITNTALEISAEEMAQLKVRVHGIQIDEKTIEDEMLKWVRTYSYDSVINIDDTKRNFIRQVMCEGLGKKMGEQWITEKLKKMFNETQAKTIAITETTRAMNEALMTAWREAGVKKIRWQTMEDLDVDEICQDNEMQGVMHLGEKFSSGHIAPPAHINCRCYLEQVSPLQEETVYSPQVFQPFIAKSAGQ